MAMEDDDWPKISVGNVWPDLSGKRFSVVVVGPAGEGKSSLVNTITFTQKCGHDEEAIGALTDVHLRVRLEQETDGQYASLVVYDSPGFTGSDENDDMVTGELSKVHKPDLILVCFSFMNNSGRFLPMVHGSVMNKVRTVWGDEAMKKVVVVLTNSDLASSEYERQEACAGREGHTAESRAKGAQRFTDDVQTWKEQLLRNQRRKMSHDIPVCVTGLLGFSEPGFGGVPYHLTAVGGKKNWHDTLWRTVARDASDPVGRIFLALLDQAKSQHEGLRVDLEGDDGSDKSQVKKAIVGAATAVVVSVTAIALAPGTLGTSAAVGALAVAVGFAVKACMKAGWLRELTGSKRDASVRAGDSNV